MENNQKDPFGRAIGLLGESLTQLRDIAHQLMPSLLIRKGLKAALSDFCAHTENVSFDFSGDERRFEEKLEIETYRIAYELIKNTKEQSRLSQIYVKLSIDEKSVNLDVKSDGKVFDFQDKNVKIVSESIKNRTEAINGKLEIVYDETQETGASVAVQIN